MNNIAGISIASLALAGALTFAVPAAAQDPSLMEHLRKAESTRNTLRVTTADTFFDGRISSLNDSTFTVRNQRVFLRDVTELHRKVGSSTGAMVGGLIGGVTLGVLGFGLSGLCDYDCTDDRIKLTSAGFLTGGVLGGMIGAALDRKKPVLEPVWAAVR